MKLRLYIAILLVCGGSLPGCARPSIPAPPITQVNTETANSGESEAVSDSPNVVGAQIIPGANPEAPSPSPSPILTLCAASERTLFSCAIQHSQKAVVICASKDLTETKGYVYYAYGTAKQKELIYPADKAPPSGRFKRTHLGYAGNTGGYAYSFANNGIKYIVYSISGADAIGEHGVMAMRGESRAPLTKHDCQEGTVTESDNEDLIDLTLGWKEDATIARRGLPGRN